MKAAEGMPGASSAPGPQPAKGPELLDAGPSLRSLHGLLTLCAKGFRNHPRDCTQHNQVEHRLLVVAAQRFEEAAALLAEGFAAVREIRNPVQVAEVEWLDGNDKPKA